MNYWKTVFYFAVIGTLLGLLHVRLLDSGYIKQWKQPPQPNGVDFEIIGMSWRTAYVQTTDNTILECLDYKATCTPPREFDSCDTVDASCQAHEIFTEQVAHEVHSCDYNFVAFSWTTNPPRNIRTCLQLNLPAVDSVTDVVAVIDEGGQLWFWENMHGGFGRGYAEIILVVFEAIMGFILANLIFFASKIYRKFKVGKQPIL